MVAKVESAALVGVDAEPVEVEVQTSRGTPLMDVVGLPEMSVRESRVRVRSAIRQSALRFPTSRVIVNLAPADLRKEGTGLDLPIALGVLAASGDVPQDALDGWLCIGELALGGELRPVRGVLAVAELARRLGRRGVVCCAANAAEAAAVPGVEVRGVRTLSEAVACLAADTWETPERCDARAAAAAPCWSDVRGQALARRAAEVAAAGAHNLVMVGTPGTGKTMLARRIPGILPPLDDDEALTVTKIHSVAGLLPPGVGLLRQRPFRAPHHTGSATSLVGGGSSPRPGEVSLAHGGVLFLDELPEFPRPVVETLRQPIEDGFVTIARARQVARFPSRVMLVAALNPCACGWYGSKVHPCTCSPTQQQRYMSRLSGPLLDRIDIQVALEPLPPALLRGQSKGEPSAAVRGRVRAARLRQRRRYRGAGLPAALLHAGATNGAVPMAALRRTSPMAPQVHDLLLEAIARFGLSPRAHDRIWRVARTIADLADAEHIGAAHLGEALQYRHFDRAAP